MNTVKTVAEKTAPKTTQLNGTETKIATAKDAEKLPVIVPEKKQEATPALPTIEARLKKLDELQELAERRETVATAIENLDEFYIAPDGRGCNLKLQDSKGKTYAIAHPSVIGEMVSLAKHKLSAELANIENSIVFNI
jgi:hypothetical protein